MNNIILNLKSISKPKIAVDFGTANCVIIKKGKGIVLNEPTVVALSPNEKKILAVGSEAKEMLGKVPVGIEARRPVQNGGIANYRLAEALLRRFFNKSLGRIRLLKPDIIVAIPAGITSVEERALIKVLNSLGASKIYLFPEPVAAAIGAKIPIERTNGNLIVNLGGGTAEIAVISLNGVVTYQSHRGSGDAINQAIINYLKNKRSLLIGEQTAEYIKMTVGAVALKKEDFVVEVKGRSSKTGLPTSIEVNSSELIDPIREVTNIIVDSVKKVLEKTPPELLSDIYDNGIIMTGGTSMLKGLDVLLTRAIGIPAYVVEDPLTAVVRGLNEAIDKITLYNRIVKHS